MKFDPKIHHRRSIRVQGYDYTQAGAYFVTIVAWQRENLFGEVVNGEMILNNLGQIAYGEWERLEKRFKPVELGAFVIMPNHIHIIIRCLGNYAPMDIIREFKKATANLIIRQYEAECNQETLAFLAAAVKPGQKQEHAVWDDEYQAKDVFSPDFLREKMEYVHNNPL